MESQEVGGRVSTRLSSGLEEVKDEEDEITDMASSLMYQQESQELLEEQSTEESKGLQRFSLFQRRLLICVIDECINKLVIVGASKQQYPAVLNFKSGDVRYKGQINLLLYDKQTNQLIADSEAKLREIKFQRERELLIKLLSLIREELTKNTEMKVLYAFLKAENECDAESIQIAKSCEESKSKAKELKSLKSGLKDERSHITAEQESQLQRRKIQFERMKKLAVVEMIYNYRWQSARYDQNKVLIERQTRKLKEEMEMLDKKTENEDRVHKEIMKYLDISVKQIGADLEYWTTIYNTDVEKLDRKCEILRTKIEEGDKEMKNMAKALQEQKEQIAEMQIEKQRRDSLLAKEQKRIKSAIKIQAWWRGTMVRWEFGRYSDIMKRKFRKQKKPKK